VSFSAKRAEAAGSYANIRRIDVAIDVEVRLVAVHALTHRICQPADREDVARAGEREGVVAAQALMGEYFVSDGIKPTVLGLKGMALRCACARHYFDHTAGKCWKSQTFISRVAHFTTSSVAKSTIPRVVQVVSVG
jgi:hypothetical protein